MNDRVQVKGYEGLYEISSNGEVYSLTKNVMLNQRIGISGYMEVRLKKNGSVRHKTIHRLLAEAFIPNPENKPCIDHIDGNKLNNNLSNLRWCTHKENSNNPNALRKFSESATKAWKDGRKMSIEAIKKRSKSNCKHIAQYSKDGNLIKIWDSIKEASLVLNICRSHIGEVCADKRKTAGGFVFTWLDRPEDKKSSCTVDAYPAHCWSTEPLAIIRRKEQ